MQTGSHPGKKNQFEENFGGKDILERKKIILVKNTSLAAPGALAHRLQRRNACNAAEANLHSANLKTEITSLLSIVISAL